MATDASSFATAGVDMTVSATTAAIPSRSTLGDNFLIDPIDDERTQQNARAISPLPATEDSYPSSVIR